MGVAWVRRWSDEPIAGNFVRRNRGRKIKISKEGVCDDRVHMCTQQPKNAENAVCINQAYLVCYTEYICIIFLYLGPPVSSIAQEWRMQYAGMGALIADWMALLETARHEGGSKHTSQTPTHT